MVVFKSMIKPWSQTTARLRLKSQEKDCPMICPLELIAFATLKQSPGNVPRSAICPFLQSVAWNDASSVVLAPPTASPALLSQITVELLPPKVPKSVTVPWSHENA